MMELKEKTIAAATELFFRYGIKRITMDDISREMGISKKTLYQSFKDKDEVVELLTDCALDSNICIMDKIIGGSKDPIHELIEAGKHLGTVFSKINPIFFYDLKRYYPAAWKKFQCFKDKHIIRIVEQNLKKGIDLKIYRADLNIALMARYRVAQIDLALDPAVFPPDKWSLAETHVFLLDHFMHGITTIKGHKLINKYKQLSEEE